ncbi:hypothetical protein FRB90_012544 [Tulasnella sp. 427]|nr:hypothetical protein FRB90_012544 [Tulasnella sp. 427]
MGAQGSKAGQSEGGDKESSVDYYTLLEVSEDATQDEIRNPNDIEAATQKFATLQQAYEVLSDEQERAWYDSHRASLAPEPDAEAVFEDIRKGAPPPGRRRMNDPGLQAKHIMRFMDASIWKTMDDSDSGFFTIYRNLFTRLAYEENNFNEQNVDYPSFGTSSWPWTASSGLSSDLNTPREAARTFYNAWLSFSTAKDFAWKDLWNVAEAPDRRARRMMEQENKKARDDARREYNDVVRALVTFARKRDPRYKAHLESVKQATAAIGAGRSRPVTGNKGNAKATDDFIYVEQAWQQTSSNTALDSEWGTDEQWGAEGEEGEEIECVVCQKTFKSERAWANHEQSKKHLKEVEMLKFRLRRENQELGLSNDDQDVSDPVTQDDRPKAQGANMHSVPQETNNDAVMAELSLDDDQRRSASPPVAEAEGEPKRSKQKLKGKRFGNQNPVLDSVETNQARSESDHDEDGADGPTNANPSTSSTPLPGPSKREKRRAREAAKKAKEAESNEAEKAETCNVCTEEFSSRTKLFAHIKETGHALAQPDKRGKGNGQGDGDGKRKAKAKR